MRLNFLSPTLGPFAIGPRASVRLLPHAAAAGAQAVLGLQALLKPLFDDGLQLQAADPVPDGDEGQTTRCTPPTGSTLIAVLWPLGSTPGSEVHGLLLDTLAQAAMFTADLRHPDAQAMDDAHRALRT